MSLNVTTFGMGLSLQWPRNTECGGVCVNQASVFFPVFWMAFREMPGMISKRGLLRSEDGLKRVARITREARKSLPGSRNRMYKGVMENGGWIQYLSAKHCSKFYFTFLIRISAHELTSNMKSVSLLYN